ncbi:MAG: hypothetical protein ACXV4D_06165 [Ilumatobacteraceae bacterium]
MSGDVIEGSLDVLAGILFSDSTSSVLRLPLDHLEIHPSNVFGTRRLPVDDIAGGDELDVIGFRDTRHPPHVDQVLNSPGVGRRLRHTEMSSEVSDFAPPSTKSRTLRRTPVGTPRHADRSSRGRQHDEIPTHQHHPTRGTSALGNTSASVWGVG